MVGWMQHKAGALDPSLKIEKEEDAVL